MSDEIWSNTHDTLWAIVYARVQQVCSSHGREKSKSLRCRQIKSIGHPNGIHNRDTTWAYCVLGFCDRCPSDSEENSTFGILFKNTQETPLLVGFSSDSSKRHIDTSHEHTNGRQALLFETGQELNFFVPKRFDLK
jgi:hypothetical protein